MQNNITIKRNNIQIVTNSKNFTALSNIVKCPYVKRLKSWCNDYSFKNSLSCVLIKVTSNDPLVCSVSSVLDMEQKTVQDMCAGWDNLQDQNWILKKHSSSKREIKKFFFQQKRLT